MTQEISELASRYEAMKAENPSMRIRNIAEALGVSEAELLATRIGKDVIRLENRPKEILAELEPLGEVMALTRNESCVNENKGIYKGAKFFERGKMNMGLFVTPEIDLRLFMDHWTFTFAVTDETKAGTKKSLQFFDKSGEALHKIHLTNHSDEAAYDAVVAKYQAEDQNPALALTAYPAPAADLPDEEIDWEGLRTSWENMKDTHDFFGMLRKYKVGREQAFRKIGTDLAYEVDTDAVRKVVEMAREKECEIMIFVGNRGCIQIFTGAVNKLVDYGTWFNIMDPKYTMHLNEAEITRCWVTKKPTVDGDVTALEVFDKDGNIIATFFGKRKPGEKELDTWREIIAALSPRKVANAA
ncbi:hemin-degrading factor [Sneathiella limimaris]|uniref:hemin-degrading factor n=1 Tax=Sneathiella limimaris TaxID=1964213 RepID=UPI00146DB5F0|nr:ChuX/HutX family heme-like substrate-binding protein [Sneathiella limimaris]